MTTKKPAAKKPAAKKKPATKKPAEKPAAKSDQEASDQEVKAGKPKPKQFAPVATPNEVDLVKENEALKLEVARLKQRNRRKL